jgi:hypothetical protein
MPDFIICWQRVHHVPNIIPLLTLALCPQVMIRRLKKEVLGQLPPKRRQVVRLPHPPRDRWLGGMQPGDGEGSDGDDEEDDVRYQQLEYAPWRVGMGGVPFPQSRREGATAGAATAAVGPGGRNEGQYVPGLCSNH